MNNIEKLKPTGLFTNYIYKAIPLAFDESMSYYETLLGLLYYVKNTVIPTVNNNADALIELQNLYTELHNYVEHYFDNLDVQEEINNKLDEMAESGQLTDIIAQYLGLAGMITFNNVSEMKLAENIVNGSKCATLGYYNVNDGGNSFYKIRTITNEDVVDDATIIALNDNTLIAELISPEILNIRQVGGKSDGTSVVNAINNALKTNASTIYFPEGTYLLDNYVIINKNLKGYKATINVNRPNYTTEEAGIVLIGNNLKMENIKLHVISDNKGITIRDSNNLIIENCKLTTATTGRTLGGLLDIFRNNHNITIENCYFETHSSNTGGIWVREGTSGSVTNNVHFNNCEFIGDTQDETIAIWGWFGTVENVIVSNSKLTKPLNTDIINPMFITIGQGAGTTKNCGFENCTIESYQNTSCIIQGSETQDSNIFLRNCVITSHMESLANGIIISRDGSEGIHVENCIINELNVTNNPRLTLNQATKYKNCTFNCATQIHIDWGTYENCIFNNNPLITRSTGIARSLYAKNCIFNGINNTGTYLIATTNANDSIKIEECKFYGTMPYRFIIAGGTAYKSTVPFILTNSFIHGQVNADSTNILKGCVCGNYNSYNGMGTQSENLAVANNEVSFNYQ